MHTLDHQGSWREIHRGALGTPRTHAADSAREQGVVVMLVAATLGILHLQEEMTETGQGEETTTTLGIGGRHRLQ